MMDYEEKAKKNLEKFNAFLADDPRVEKLNEMYEVFGEQLLSTYLLVVHQQLQQKILQIK